MFKPEVLERAIQDGPEIIVFCLIEHAGEFIWRMEHEMAHNRIPAKD